MYPYLPPHIARPKEVRRVYAVQLPERCYLAVRRVCMRVCVGVWGGWRGAERTGGGGRGRGVVGGGLVQLRERCWRGGGAMAGGSQGCLPPSPHLLRTLPPPPPPSPHLPCPSHPCCARSLAT